MTVAEAQFPGERGDAALARRLVRTAVSDAGLADLSDVAVLLTSELVTNAVLHARSRVTVRVEVGDGVLRVEVEDGSPVLPTRKRYSDASATGRGVLLVEALARRWGVEELPTGKRVWFVLDAAPTGSRAGETLDDAAGVGAAAGAGDSDLDLDQLAAAFGEVDRGDGRESLLVG